MNVQPPNPAGVSAIGPSTPTTMASPPPTPALNGTLAGIAARLGMSLGDVQSALRSGQSVTALAEQQGVSRSALAQSVQADVRSAAQSNGRPAPDPATIERMVNRALDRQSRSA